MKAVVHHRYGSPDVLKLEEIPTPTVGDDEVLVRVHAASANAGDWHLMRADPFFIRLMFGGLLRPRHKVLGSDVAGTVAAVGKDVAQLEPGDEVFGDVFESGLGGFAEYVSAPAAALVRKPAGTTFEEAAAVPLAGRTALQGLRNFGKIRAGHRVAINGASGGVGTFAVQIAKSLGAEVTGICSTRNVEMVRSIGADYVIDYTREDFTHSQKRYDVILDAAAYRSVSDYRRVLSPCGTYVMVGGAPSRLFQLMFLRAWASVTNGNKMELVDSKANQQDLQLLKELIEAGEIAPVIDRQYDLSDVPEAIRYLEQGRARGKVVITVNPA